ncbi:MAG: hypothetical protein ACI4UY_13110 [Kiritimatiellia bacterium]
MAFGVICWFSLSPKVQDNGRLSSNSAVLAVKDLSKRKTANGQGKSRGSLNNSKKKSDLNKLDPTGIDSIPVEGDLDQTSAEESVKGPPPHIFTNVSDQILAMVATSSGDAPPIPFSDDMEKQFLASLDSPIVISDADSENIRVLKQTVIEMRAEVMQMMSKGQSLRQILSEHQQLSRQNAEIRRNALIELKGIIASGDVEGASEYKRKINIALEQMGISKLNIPVTKEDHERVAKAKEQRKIERRLMKEQEQR